MLIRTHDRSRQKARSGSQYGFPRVFLGALTIVLILTVRVRGQETAWSFSGAIGYALLPMKQVNRDNQHDVEGWREGGIPLPDFPSFNGSSFMSGKVIYRPSSYFAFSFAALTASMGGHTSYSDTGVTLSLERSVGSSDLILGVIGYLPPRWYPLEFYIEVGIWYTSAWARAKAYGETSISVHDTSYTLIIADADATYGKSKTTAGIGLGASVPVVKPLVLKGEARYRNALFGPMEGEITRYGETNTVTSFIDFDYSGLFLSIGLAIEF